MKRKFAQRDVSHSFDGRFTAYATTAVAAAAGLGGFDIATAEGAIVYSGVRNIAVDPSTNFGIYIDFEANAAVSAAGGSAALPGYDLNLYTDDYTSEGSTSATGRGVTVSHPAGKTTNGEVTTATTAPDDTLAAKLEAGAAIGPGQLFTVQRQAYGLTTLLAYQPLNDPAGEFGDWASDATLKFLGVRFVTNGETKYGWVRLTVGDGPVYPFTVHDWAYESSGAAIAAGAIPEPAAAGTALGALALGAIRRPRKH